MYRAEIERFLKNAFGNQEITSAETSINSARLPAIFSKITFEPETVNLDYGGGKFDNVTAFLTGKNVENLIFDPFNREMKHNVDIIEQIIDGKRVDTVTCSNVLNVISEMDDLRFAVALIDSLCKKGAKIYFSVYEGDGSGVGRETSKGYQRNQKLASYLPLIQEHFPFAHRKGGIIIAEK